MIPEAVFLVDDDPGVRNGLGAALESAGFPVESFGSAEDFLAQFSGQDSGCLLLDLRLGGMSGVQLLEKLHAAQSPLPVIMITGHGDVSAAVACMKLGAVDFLEKPVEPTLLAEKIRGVLENQRQRHERAADADEARRRLAHLTPRETELLKFLATGRSSKQIALALNISQKTVENHRGHLLAKAQAENMVDLVRLAMLAGLV